MRAVGAVVILAVVVAVACLKTVSYQCSNDTFCQHAGVQGTCESTGYCAFPDMTCPMGERYGDEGPFAGQCVGSNMIDGGSGDATDAPPDVPTGPSFTVGGNVSGLSGSGPVVIADNVTDMKSISSNGQFTFAQKVVTGAGYDVTVVTNPPSLACIVVNGTGTMGSADVTNVHVTCSTPGSSGIACGGSTCTPVGSEMCCHGKSDSTGSCAAVGGSCSGGTAQELCDSNSDCGGTPNVCCAHLSSAGAISGTISCVSDSSACVPIGMGTAQILCDPADATPCPASMACTGNDATHGWKFCQ